VHEKGQGTVRHITLNGCGARYRAPVLFITLGLGVLAACSGDDAEAIPVTTSTEVAPATPAAVATSPAIPSTSPTASPPSAQGTAPVGTPLVATGAARSGGVVISVSDLTLSYEIDYCPIDGWLAETGGQTFGDRTDGIPASDGRMWATVMMSVMRFNGGQPSDWSFVLATPPGVSSAQNERRLTSGPNILGSSMDLELSDHEARFTTHFLDAGAPRSDGPLAGGVTVTCK